MKLKLSIGARRSILLVFFLLAIITLCGLAIFIVPVPNIENLFPPTVTLVTYDKSTVLSVCQLFKLGTNDEFCLDAEHQNVFTLKALLIRLFPSGKATYKDIIPFFQYLESKPSYTCHEAFENPSLGFCPQPQSCQANYYCTVTFPGSVRSVDIDFDHSTGLIEGFRVSNTQAGSQ